MFRLFGKNKTPNPNPMPAWMKWLVMAFLAYALLNGMRTDRTGSPAGPVQESFQRTVTNLNPNKYFNFSDFKQTIFPSLSSSLHVKDNADGTGNPAVCGQDVALAYDTFLPDGTKYTDSASKESPKRIRLGEGSAMPVFEQGLIGMKAGGKRSILSPPQMAYSSRPEFAREDVSTATPVRFDIEVLDITPALPDFSATSYRIIPANPGMGSPILCGQPGKFHITIWDLDGKRLYSSKDDGGQPLAFTPGKGEVMLGIEQGVIGMPAGGGSRALIIPPSFQKTMRGEKPAIDFPLPGQTVLVDVEAVQ